MTRSLILKQLSIALALSTAFTVGFCYGVKAEEGLGQLPARQADNSSLVIRKHRPLIDSSGNRVGHFICGLTQRLHYRISNPKYNLALAWADFPHASPAPEVVVVQTRKGHALGGGRGGHVSRIVELTNDPRFAIVTDEKGTYRRDIKKNLVAYVRPQ